MKSDEDKLLAIYKDLHELVQADIHYHHEIYSKSSIIVESLFDKVEKNSDKFEEQYELLQQEIKNIIKDKIISYNKEVLIIFLLTIKELATYATIISPEAINWNVASKIERSLILLSFLLFIPKEEFKNRNILNTKDKISVIEALALAGRIELLTENVQKVLNGHIVKSLKDCIAFFIEDEKDTNYYEEYIRMGKNEKPEDISFTNPTINKYIEHAGMSISKIYALINEDFKSEIGFSINDMDEFGSFIYKFHLVQKDVYILIHHYDFFLNLFMEQTKLSKNTFDNIVSFFSINNLVNKGIMNERFFELRCIYIFDDLMVFGLYDLIQRIHIFKQLLLSGDFIEKYFFINKKNINKFDEAKNRMASLLAYKLAELLYLNGYTLPMTDFEDELIPKIEVNDIVNSNGKNIFTSFYDRGDVDILAIDKSKGIIYNIEFKYFAPGLEYWQLIKKDKNKIEKNNVSKKVLTRQDAIEKNVKLVLEYCCVSDSKEYKVESILVTARPNYYAISNDIGVKYYSWVDMIDRIKRKEI